MKKKIAILVVIILVILIGFIKLGKNVKDETKLELYGNIEIRQVDLSFQVSGNILKMLKEEGDTVKEGDVLAILDDRDYKANYNNSVSQILKTKAIKNDALQIYERNLALCNENIVSKQQCQTYLNNKNKTNADFLSAVSNKNVAKNKLDYTKIISPTNGIITTRIQEEGANVQSGQLVYTLTKIDPVWIRAYVNETELGNIKHKMKAKIILDSIDPTTKQKREYQGHIGYISPVAEFTPKTVETTELRANLVYKIKVYVDNTDAFLRQGMPATVQIDLTQGE